MRAVMSRTPGPSRPFSEVRGLPRRARSAVRRLEARRFGPGFLAASLRGYEGALRRPGRWLYVESADCPCHDPMGDRDGVEAFLRSMPRLARRDLRSVVARLDEEFERRTLPDPFAPPGAWWQRRLGSP